MADSREQSTIPRGNSTMSTAAAASSLSQAGITSAAVAVSSNVTSTPTSNPVNSSAPPGTGLSASADQLASQVAAMGSVIGPGTGGSLAAVAAERAASAAAAMRPAARNPVAGHAINPAAAQNRAAVAALRAARDGMPRPAAAMPSAITANGQSASARVRAVAEAMAAAQAASVGSRALVDDVAASAGGVPRQNRLQIEKGNIPVVHVVPKRRRPPNVAPLPLDMLATQREGAPPQASNWGLNDFANGGTPLSSVPRRGRSSVSAQKPASAPPHALGQHEMRTRRQADTSALFRNIFTPEVADSLIEESTSGRIASAGVLNGARGHVNGHATSVGPGPDPGQAGRSPFSTRLPERIPLSTTGRGSPYFTSLGVGDYVHRLIKYNEEQRKCVRASSLERDWKPFVREFFAPTARLSLSLLSSQTGLLRKVSIPYEVIARVLKSKFDCGATDERLLMEDPCEYRLQDGAILVQSRQTTILTQYPGRMVHTSGRLRVRFSQTMKILSWDFCTNAHQELFSRDGVGPGGFIPQVSESGVYGYPHRVLTLMAMSEKVQDMRGLMKDSVAELVRHGKIGGVVGDGGSDGVAGQTGSLATGVASGGNDSQRLDHSQDGSPLRFSGSELSGAQRYNENGRLSPSSQLRAEDLLQEGIDDREDAPGGVNTGAGPGVPGSDRPADDVGMLDFWGRPKEVPSDGAPERMSMPREALVRGEALSEHRRMQHMKGRQQLLELQRQHQHRRQAQHSQQSEEVDRQLLRQQQEVRRRKEVNLTQRGQDELRRPGRLQRGAEAFLAMSRDSNRPIGDQRQWDELPGEVGHAGPEPAPVDDVSVARSELTAANARRPNLHSASRFYDAEILARMEGSGSNADPGFGEIPRSLPRPGNVALNAGVSGGVGVAVGLGVRESAVRDMNGGATLNNAGPERLSRRNGAPGGRAGANGDSAQVESLSLHSLRRTKSSALKDRIIAEAVSGTGNASYGEFKPPTGLTVFEASDDERENATAAGVADKDASAAGSTRNVDDNASAANRRASGQGDSSQLAGKEVPGKGSQSKQGQKGPACSGSIQGGNGEMQLATGTNGPDGDVGSGALVTMRSQSALAVACPAVANPTDKGRNRESAVDAGASSGIAASPGANITAAVASSVSAGANASGPSATAEEDVSGVNVDRGMSEGVDGEASLTGSKRGRGRGRGSRGGGRGSRGGGRGVRGGGRGSRGGGRGSRGGARGGRGGGRGRGRGGTASSGTDIPIGQPSNTEATRAAGESSQGDSKSRTLEMPGKPSASDGGDVSGSVASGQGATLNDNGGLGSAFVSSHAARPCADPGGDPKLSPTNAGVGESGVRSESVSVVGAGTAIGQNGAQVGPALAAGDVAKTSAPEKISGMSGPAGKAPQAASIGMGGASSLIAATLAQGIANVEASGAAIAGATPIVKVQHGDQASQSQGVEGNGADALNANSGGKRPTRASTRSCVEASSETAPTGASRNGTRKRMRSSGGETPASEAQLDGKLESVGGRASGQPGKEISFTGERSTLEESSGNGSSRDEDFNPDNQDACGSTDRPRRTRRRLK